jgi:hypothetical protein
MPKELPGVLQRIADRYAAFAADEARGNSAVYEKLALAIADAPEILDFIASLPAPRSQPNCSSPPFAMCAAACPRTRIDCCWRCGASRIASARSCCRRGRRPTSRGAVPFCCRFSRFCRRRWR